MIITNSNNDDDDNPQSDRQTPTRGESVGSRGGRESTDPSLAEPKSQSDSVSEPGASSSSA